MITASRQRGAGTRRKVGLTRGTPSPAVHLSLPMSGPPIHPYRTQVSLASRSLLLCVCASVASARLAFSQCPDGSPPPCRSAAARRAPALDERTWIVLPFANTTRAPDVDWLSAASANLLYLGLARWTDVRAVDDGRVVDLLREAAVPRGEAIGLEAGLALARRAGAGRLVMGDFIRAGSTAQLVAKVYNVRSGQRLRNVSETAQLPDSVMPAFARLAARVLDLPPAPGLEVGAGTANTDAYRAYLAGTTALKGWALDSAATLLRRAVSLDSTFALARYRLAIASWWIGGGADSISRGYAEGAVRWGGSLPARERSRIAALRATLASRFTEACGTYESLLRADSSDAESWYFLGECNYHNQRVEYPGGDSARPAFVGNWNRATLAFRRALELDPTFHLAYYHLVEMPAADQRSGCRASDAGIGCPFEDQFSAGVARAGDSLVIAPIRMADPGAAPRLRRDVREAARSGALRANLESARGWGEAWAAAGPSERGSTRPRAMLNVLLRLGLAAEAARALEHVVPVTVADSLFFVGTRIEVLLRLDSSMAAARLLDSLLTRQQDRWRIWQVAAALGRFQPYYAISRTFGVPPGSAALVHAMEPVQVGAPPSDLWEIERRGWLAVDSSIEADASLPARARQTARARVRAMTVTWSLGTPRPGAVLVSDPDAADPRFDFAAVAVTGDTARTRQALVRLDSIVLGAPREVDASALVVSAEGHVLLGDSALALARLLEFERRWPFQRGITNAFGPGEDPAILVWGRAWLLMGDLAIAGHQNDVAIRAYRRVVGMWDGADAPLQPAVTRARAALARMGAQP